MRLPSGTITFLFTDIEGSTELWESHPEAMQAALAQHDEILRAAIERNGGHVFKTIGDAFCVAFHVASDAVRASLDAQLDLARAELPLPIKFRAAIHTGAAEARDNDYFGQPLNRVARLLGIGYGGQILLSDVAHDLCRDFLPDGASLKFLGEHRLKDLGRPEPVYQFCHPLLAPDFPALRSLNNALVKNNLPEQLSSFVGRERELREVGEMLGRSRLLTLTGAGGCGKTRLCLQAAAELLDGDGDGVWFVELASISGPELLAQTVASALGVKEQREKPILNTLIEFLASKRILLVLDNCEHVLHACAEFATLALRQCPQVRMLASSREALSITGETTYRVPSLSHPDSDQTHTAESLSAYESVRLFVDRALQVQRGFQVTNANAPALASICNCLDGIPLAIELAAARVRSITVDEINTRLNQRFRLLTGGSRTSVPRQQTLRSLIDWSYDLLNSEEQSMLRRLSVFAGGWSLESAEEICAAEGIDEFQVVDLLTSLVEKNLVVFEERGGCSRYFMLQTVVQYAMERLGESGESDLWRERHAVHFARLAKQAEEELRNGDQAHWFRRLRLDLDNFRVALKRGIEESDDPELALGLASALNRFWVYQGYITEGERWCELALAKGGDAAAPAPRAACLAVVGGLGNCSGRLDYAVDCYELAREIHRQLGNASGEAHCLNGLGNNAWGRGRFEDARRLYGESLRIYEEAGDEAGAAIPMSNMGLALMELDAEDEAWTLFERSLAMAKERDDTIGIASTYQNLGALAIRTRHYDRARAYLRESITVSRLVEDRVTLANALESLGNALQHLSGYLAAARLWGAAERLLQEIGGAIIGYHAELREARIAAARAAHGNDEEFDSAWQEWSGLSLDEVIERALAC